MVVICPGADSIPGAIEYSGPGISYSRPLAEYSLTAMDDSCAALVTTAEVDSAAVITLGTDIPLAFFDLEHEPLFYRTADTLLPNLIDSAVFSGDYLTLHLHPNIRFSDGRRLDAEALDWWLRDLQYRSRSYPVRFFFAKLLPFDDGGIELIDAFTVKLRFYHPLPRAGYLLSHPDFAVYNHRQRGTGAVMEIGYATPGETQRAFAPNPYYRGRPAAFSRLIVRLFEQAYRMKYEYENDIIDGYIGFGFDADLAGRFEARAQYPYEAVLFAAIDRPSFSEGLFPTSLYYRFDEDRAHLFFPRGQVTPVHRWLTGSSSETRYYPFDVERGVELHRAIGSPPGDIDILYDDYLLRQTGDYLADIAAREGMRTNLSTYSFGRPFDLRVAFVPASDSILPLALYSAVLELNDQNTQLPSRERMDRPGWSELGQGSRLSDPANRNNFFTRAETTVIDEGCFFPLYRPWLFAVKGRKVRGMAFDFYGYPQLDGVVSFKNLPAGGGGGGR
jgi:hypothetical protein